MVQSGRAGESHPHAPTVPCVNLSIHTALLIQSIGFQPSALLYAKAPPISGWPNHKVGWANPFAPPALHRFHHYYELVRPCASHRYSHSCGASTWVSPLTSGRQVPTFRTKAWNQVHAIFMPDAAQTISRSPLDLSWKPASTPVLTSSLIFRHLINGSLSLISLIHTWSRQAEPFP